MIFANSHGDIIAGIGALVTAIEFGGSAHQWNQAAQSAIEGSVLIIIICYLLLYVIIVSN